MHEESSYIIQAFHSMYYVHTYLWHVSHVRVVGIVDSAAV